MKFTLEEIKYALPRILEWADTAEELQEWYKRVGIDRESLYIASDMLAPRMETTEGAFIYGVILAWEIARSQK